MHIIRNDQINTLAKSALSNFEERMIDHLRRCFPDECNVLGSDGTKIAIQHAIKRAAIYRIESERDVCAYTDVMFAFGRDFDQNSELQWVVDILHDPALEYDPTEKAEQLFAAALTNAEQAQGIQPESEEQLCGR